MNTLIFALKLAYAYAVLHQTAICVAIGVWAFAATLINRAWPKPAATAPRWKRALHFLLADWPAFVASKNGRTFGRFKIAIPFVTWSTIIDAVTVDKSEEPTVKVPLGSSLRMLLPVAFIALAVSGCATAQKDTMLGEIALGKAVSLGYRTADGIDAVRTDAIRAEKNAGQLAKAQADFAAYQPKIVQTLAGLDAGEDLLEATDKARQAAQKGVGDWKDYTAYLPQLAAMTAKIEALISDLQAVAK